MVGGRVCGWYFLRGRPVGIWCREGFERWLAVCLAGR